MQNELVKNTRIGLAPARADFTLGAYRTLVANALAAKYFGGETYLRIDDTNPKIHRTEHLSPLISRIIGDIGVPVVAPRVEHDIYDGVPIVRQSMRQDKYMDAIEHLVGERYAVTEKDGSIRLSIAKWRESFGDDLEYTYGYGINQSTSGVSLDAEVISRDKIGPVLKRGHSDPALFLISSVVDDIEMNIGVIVRGPEDISAQPIHEMLRRILGGSPIIHLYSKKMIGANTSQAPRYGELARLYGHAAVNCYLFSGLSKMPEKIYPTIDDISADFDPSSIKPGIDKFDEPRLRSIAKKLGRLSADG